MKKLRKNIIRLVCIAITAVVAVSCSESLNDPAPKDPDKKVEKPDKLLEWRYKKHDRDTTWVNAAADPDKCRP